MKDKHDKHDRKKQRCFNRIDTKRVYANVEHVQKGVKEYGLNKDVYDFDMFFCDVFALFLKTVKYGDVERVLNAAAKRVNVEEVLQDNELTCNDKAVC